MLKRLTGSYSKNEQEHAKAKITAKHQNCLNITTLFPQIIFSNHHPCRSFQPVTVLNYPRLSFCVWQRNHFLGHTLRFTCKLRLFNLDGGGLQPHHLSSVIGTLPFRKEKHEIKFQNWRDVRETTVAMLVIELLPWQAIWGYMRLNCAIYVISSSTIGLHYR